MGCAPQPREPLRELYTPSFPDVPPQVDATTAVRALQHEWKNGGRDTLLGDLLSAQGGIAIGAFVLVLLVAWPVAGRQSRLADLLLLCTAGLPFFAVMRFFDHLRDASYLWLLDVVFVLVMLFGAALAIRATLVAIRPRITTFEPRLKSSVLSVLAVLLLGVNVALALQRPPDDAGWFVNLGAQRLRERGLLPYGDPLTTGTPAAAYGPLMYVAHVPFQFALAPRPLNPHAPDKPSLGDTSQYYLPPMIATQLCAVAFHIAGIIALFIATRRWSHRRSALAVVVLYCGSLAVLGIGGRDYGVAGITFISHIAPASMTLVALAMIERPLVAGTSLVAAAGLGFYPALFGPIWLGYYWRNPRARLRFVVGCGAAAIVLCGFVLATSRGGQGQSRIQTIVSDTLGHHTNPAGYGRSPFGFWGQRPGWREWVMRPLLGASSLTSPAWLGLLGYVVAAAVLAVGRGAGATALFCAVTALGFALVKPHATGSYLAWYYPLILFGFALPRFTSEPQEV